MSFMKRRFQCFVLAGLQMTGLLRAQTLTSLWECDAVLDKPESALYCAECGSMFISNISGEYFEIDGTGFISKLGLDGSVTELKWFEGGLNNPQGLSSHDGILYVADLTRIVGINMESGQQESEIVIEGSEFINDLSVDVNGDIYASECKLNRIYRIRAEVVELWLEGSELNGINGILCLDEVVLFVNFVDGRFFAVDKLSKELTLIVDGIANGDGITSDGEGGFFVSGAWQGEVFHVDRDGIKKQVLDLGPEDKIAADITYIPSQQLLVIPTLNRTVLGYRCERAWVLLPPTCFTSGWTFDGTWSSVGTCKPISCRASFPTTPACGTRTSVASVWYRLMRIPIRRRFFRI